MKHLTHIIILPAVIWLSVLVAVPTHAQTSPPPAASSSTTSETTQKLRDRIEKIVEEKREQIAGALDELTTQRHGYIGEVQRITAETLTVRSMKGVRIISLSPEVTLSKAGKSTTVDQVAVGDWAVVIGSRKDDDLKPERIIISSQSLRPKAQVVALGAITKLSATSLTLQSRSNAEQLIFSLPKTTIYQDVNGNPIKANQVSSDMQAFVVGQRPDETTVNALVVRVLVANPQPTTPTPSPRSTSRPASPRPSASPRATATPRATTTP